MNRRTCKGAASFQPLRQTPVIASRLRAGLQPLQMPDDRVPPLLELPFLPRPILPQNLAPPESPRRLPPRRKLAPQSEILEPFQNQQKPRPLPSRQAPKLRKILSPAPAAFCRTHDETQKTGRHRSRQPEMFTRTHSESGVTATTAAGRRDIGGGTHPVGRTPRNRLIYAPIPPKKSRNSLSFRENSVLVTGGCPIGYHGSRSYD
jgi:hypothetical protein